MEAWFKESIWLVLYHYFGWNIKRLIGLLVLHRGQMCQLMIKGWMSLSQTSQFMPWGRCNPVSCF